MSLSFLSIYSVFLRFFWWGLFFLESTTTMDITFITMHDLSPGNIHPHRCRIMGLNWCFFGGVFANRSLVRRC